MKSWLNLEGGPSWYFMRINSKHMMLDFGGQAETSRDQVAYGGRLEPGEFLRSIRRVSWCAHVRLQAIQFQYLALNVIDYKTWCTKQLLMEQLSFHCAYDAQ